MLLFYLSVIEWDYPEVRKWPRANTAFLNSLPGQ